MTKKHWIVVGSFIAGFLALGYLGWAFLIEPVNKDIGVKQQELTDAKAKLQDALAKAAQKEKFQATAENVRRDLALVAARVNPTMPTPELYWIFSSLGNRLALPKYSFEERPREASKDGALAGMDRIALKVKFESGFREVGMFLNGIVSQERLMTMENFRIVGNMEGSRPSVSCDLDLALFLEKAAK